MWPEVYFPNQAGPKPREEVALAVDVSGVWNRYFLWAVLAADSTRIAFNTSVIRGGYVSSRLIQKLLISIVWGLRADLMPFGC